MDHIKFQEESSTRRPITKSGSSFARRLIIWGIVKTERQANVIFLVLILMAGVITLYNLKNLTETPPPPVLNETSTP